MRDMHGSFSGTVPADIDDVIDGLQAEYPSLAYAGPVESDWTEEELAAMDIAILAGLVNGRL